MESQFIPVPETTLPGGLVVPAFSVAKYLMSKGDDGKPVSVAHAEPWVEITYFDAIQANTEANLLLLRESQALALAWNASQQNINWTGGKVGEGALFQGVRNGAGTSAQPATYEPDDPDERRWLQLSNGERIYDLAGNAYSWVFDDIQGDEQGLVAKEFSEDSPSIATAPYPRMRKGMGCRPNAGENWSGDALIRGGCWHSLSCAGAFYLCVGWPDCAVGGVGFRSTQPIR